MDARTQQLLKDKLLSFDLSGMDSIYTSTIHVAALTMDRQTVKLRNKGGHDGPHVTVTERRVFDHIPPSDRLWAVFHTHPTGIGKHPAAFDLALLRDGFLGVVLHVASQTLTLYNNNHIIMAVKRRPPCPSQPTRNPPPTAVLTGNAR